MGFTTAERDYHLDELDTRATYASLHTADPGETGANELTGGTPPYARLPLTWSPSSGGSKGAAMVTFNVPAGVTVTHFGLWTAATGGTWRGGEQIPGPGEVYGSQGTLDLSITATAP